MLNIASGHAYARLGFLMERYCIELALPVGLYQQVYGLPFGPPDPDLGQARVATQSDGTVVGIRKPLAAHEQPMMRTYLEVNDIQVATK